MKAQADGHFGGYLVTFTGADDPDLTGDFFTAETDYGFADTTKSPVYFNHRLPLQTADGKRITLRDQIGEATLTKDTKGVLLDAIVYNRTEYEKDVNVAGKLQKLGWSSGTASHLVDRKPAGKAFHITKWPLGLDASLTPIQAEPYNSAIPLKLYISGLQRAAPDGAASSVTPDGVTPAAVTSPAKKETLMDEELMSALAALTTDVNEIKAKVNAPPIKTGGVVETVPESKSPFKSFGEQMRAVIKSTLHPHDADPRLAKYNAYRASELKATGMSEETLADGGALVQTEFSNVLIEKTYQVGQVLSRVPEQVIGPNANAYSALFIEETSRAAGSRYGGIRFYRIGEGATITRSAPKFRRKEIKAHKIAAICVVTDEQIQDSVQLESHLMRLFPQECSYALENEMFNGSGVGESMGILNAAATVSVAKETGQAAATVVFNNISKMWARMWAPARANAAWFINQSTEPQLDVMAVPVGTGGVPVYLPAGGLAGSPFATLKGRPVIPVEYTAALGTVGDICLVNFGEYIGVSKGGLKTDSSMHVYFTTDEMALRFVLRYTAEPTWDAALTPRDGGNTLSPYVTVATRA